MPNESPIAAYDRQLAPTRRQQRHRAELQALLAPDVDRRLLHRFLIEFCARGVEMTAPVENWIERAGWACTACGLPDLGKALVQHAVHEGGHDQLFVADTKLLVERYRNTYNVAIDAEQLLRPRRTPAVAAYVRLHEQTIASDSPYDQVAIELEIESLSVDVGPTLIAQFERVLGPWCGAGLTFLREHVAVDAGHTALNRKMLERLLSAMPEAAPSLVAAGSAALEAYFDFVAECWHSAKAALLAEPTLAARRATAQAIAAAR